MSIQILPLSGSTNGRSVFIYDATTGAGTTWQTIHTTEPLNGVGNVVSIDRIWLWANNPSATTETLIVGFGGKLTADRIANGSSFAAGSLPVKIADGIVLQGGLAVYGKCLSSASATDEGIVITGYVVRITL